MFVHAASTGHAFDFLQSLNALFNELIIGCKILFFYFCGWLFCDKNCRYSVMTQQVYQKSCLFKWFAIYFLLATPHRAALTVQLWTNEECQRHYSWAQSEKRQTKHTEAKSRYNKLSACSQKRSDVRTPLQYILRHICAPAPWIMFLLWKETGQPWIPCSIRLLRSPLTHLIKNVEWVCIQRCWFVFSF